LGQALHAAKNSSLLFDTWDFMRRYEGLLKMQWDLAFAADGASSAARRAAAGEEGLAMAAGGRGHAYHVVRAGAGSRPPSLRF